MQSKNPCSTDFITTPGISVGDLSTLKPLYVATEEIIIPKTRHLINEEKISPGFKIMNKL